MNQSVKNIRKTSIRAVLLICAFGMMHFTTGNCKESSYFSESKNNPVLSINAQNERTVYITRTGVCYHATKSCKGLSHAKAIYPVSKSEAAVNHRPCKICY
jgi:hypothetical protein